MPVTTTPTSLLGEAQEQRLRSVLSAHPRALFTDVDGTISAIAPTPEAAVLLPGIRDTLAAAAQAFDLVAAISGRAARDAYRLVNVSSLTYIGNHGLERLDRYTRQGKAVVRVHVAEDARRYIKPVNDLMDAANRALVPLFPGMRVERKGVTGSIHVRTTRDPVAAEERTAKLLEALAAPTSLVITRGKAVVEVRPPVKIDKGTTVERLIRQRKIKGAIYLGDDRTDIDAFRALRHLTEAGVCQGIAIAVLSPEALPQLATEADIALPSIEDVPELLRWLVTHAD